MKTHQVEYEHPDHGVVRVFFRWESSVGPGSRWVPMGVEFDLFTPDSECEALQALLEDVRLDRSISVSAVEHLPWEY